MQRKSGDVSQWQPLLLMLYVSRLAGLAPARFRCTPKGLAAIESRSIKVFSYLLLIALHTGFIWGVVQDLLSEKRESVRVSTPTAMAAWILEVTLTLTITTVGVYRAPRVLPQCIQYLNAANEVYIKMEGHSRKYFSKRFYYLTAIYVLLTFTVHGSDYISFISDALHHKKNTTVAYLYLCFYCESTAVVLLTMQFMQIALFIESVLDSINNALQDFIYMMELQTLPSNYITTTSEYMNMDATNFPIPVKPVNIFVDTLPALPKNNQDKAKIKRAAETLRGLQSSYVTVCEAIKGVDQCFGLTLALLIGSALLYFVVTPFYFLGYIYSREKRVINLVLQTMFLIYHFINMLMVVEPGYRTQQQMELTHSVIRQLSERSFLQFDFLTPEVDNFIKQIELNKVSYSPMKLFTVSRPLITKILSGVTTYLVILLQFQRLDYG